MLRCQASRDLLSLHHSQLAPRPRARPRPNPAGQQQVAPNCLQTTVEMPGYRRQRLPSTSPAPDLDLLQLRDQCSTHRAPPWDVSASSNPRWWCIDPLRRTPGSLSLVSVALPAVLGRLTEQLRLQREDVIEDAIDAPTREAMIGDHPGVFQVAAQ